MVWHGEGWAPPWDIAQDTLHEDNNFNSTHTGTGTSVASLQDGDEKYATGGPRSLRARNIIIGTWTVRSPRAAGKVEEQTHGMKRYRWNILGFCKVSWKKIGETSVPEGHKFYFSGNEDRHEHEVGFLIHKDTVNAIIKCRLVSSRLITICLKA